MRKQSLLHGLCVLCLVSAPAFAKDSVVADPEFDEILSQDITDLTVTSVAKRSQRLSDTAAAIYVITQEDLRRSGVYSIPDALRQVPGLQVAKTGSDRWAVSSRGFNGEVNNKLLVLIDGRAIYTPVFSGVYWGDQSTTINDIDRIEVIRGPGASLYGANAVNGVINIITKSAENTQGNLISATTTSKGNGLYEARHGGQLNDNTYYRTFGQYVDAETWYRGRSGFRMDGKNMEGDQFTLQGDAYGGEQDASLSTPTLTSPFRQTINSRNQSYGGDMLGRWSKRLAADSDISLQAYVDHYSREESNFEQHVSTADVQFQHSLKLDDRNQFIWGTGARVNYQDLIDTFSAQVDDQYDLHEIFSAFAQDEYALVPDKLYLTVGSKFEYNDFTGFELQPTGRLTWHPTQNQTVWGAVSRAVRTPSIIEEDISLLALVTPGLGGLTESRVIGNKDQQAEKLIAYEIGHRIQPTRNLSFDTALYFNDYDDLQTIGAAGTPFTAANGNTVVPYKFNNLGSGHTYGAEFAASWNVNDDWRLAGSYTYMRMNLRVDPGTAVTLESAEDLAPLHQFSVQSFYNLTETVQWDNMIYFVDHLTDPVEAYVRYDTRVSWLVQPGVEISFIGRNLLDPHKEFPMQGAGEIDRGYLGQILWKF